MELVLASSALPQQPAAQLSSTLSTLAEGLEPELHGTFSREGTVSGVSLEALTLSCRFWGLDSGGLACGAYLLSCMLAPQAGSYGGKTKPNRLVFMKVILYMGPTILTDEDGLLERLL